MNAGVFVFGDDFQVGRVLIESVEKSEHFNESRYY
jgi:hypothetical protein